MDLTIEPTLRKLESWIAQAEVDDFVCFGPYVIFDLVKDAFIGEVGRGRKFTL